MRFIIKNINWFFLYLYFLFYSKPNKYRPKNTLWSVIKTNVFLIFSVKMARGQQKIQAQAKANEKAATIRKQAGHSAADNKKTAAAGLKFACTVCKVRIYILF
jgi:hypothetical protein